MVVKAPIERGKSSTFIQALPLWLLGDDPEVHIGVATVSDDLAAPRVRTVREFIEAAVTEAGCDTIGGRLHEVFPNLLPGEPWNDQAFSVRRRMIDPNPSLMGAGLGSSRFGGKRLHWLIFDDAESDPIKVMSEPWRKMADDWMWGQAEGRLLEAGRWILDGTPGHTDGPMARAEKQGFTVFSFPAPGLPDMEYTRPRVEVADWPERWHPKALAAEKRRHPLKRYQQLVHLIPFTEADRFFTADSVRLMRELGERYRTGEGSRKADRPDYVQVYAGVDLASSRKGTDQHAIVVMLYGEHHRRPLYLARGNWGTFELVQRVIEVTRAYEPDVVAVESNGVQLMLTDTIRDPRFQEIAGASPEDADRMYVIPTETKPDAKVGPDQIRGMALGMECGRYAMPCHDPEAERLLGQIEAWTIEGHTGDYLSALWQAEQIWRAGGSREAVEESLDKVPAEGEKDPGDLSQWAGVAA